MREKIYEIVEMDLVNGNVVYSVDEGRKWALQRGSAVDL